MARCLSVKYSGASAMHIECSEFRARLRLVSAHVVNCFGQLLDHVVAIEGDLGLQQMVSHTLDEGRAHILAHISDPVWIPALSTEIGAKRSTVAASRLSVANTTRGT